MNKEGKTTALERPAFVIGISGNMDPDVSGEKGLKELKDRLRSVFWFLMGSDEKELGVGKTEVEAMLGAPLKTVGLGKWKGVGPETPVVLLSSLAPGIDQIAVEVARELGMVVKCPLPFPGDIYPTCSTFVRKADDGDEDETEEEKKARLEEVGEANTKRVAGFETVKGEVGEGNCFGVYLARDIDGEGGQPRLGPEGLELLREEHLKVEATSEDSTGRNERYRAAGEYVAAFCDVLVAVSDAEDEPMSEAELRTAPGTPGIVEAKRRGVTAGLLPMTSGITWSDNGPTFHLHQPREKQREGRIDEERSKRAGRLLRVLYPYDLRVETKKEKVKNEGEREKEAGNPEGAPWQWGDLKPRGDELRWARRGGGQFTRYVSNLGEFNRNGGPGETKGAEAVRKLLELGGKAKELGDDERFLLQQAEALKELAAVQSVASDGLCNDGGGKSLRKRNDRLVARLFWLAFFSAVLLHVFAHWHLGGEGHGEGEAAAEAGEIIAEATEAGSEHGEDGHPVEWIQVLAGMSGVACAVLGLVLLGRHKVARVEARDHDYRALAEGLRIQFYWCLAGLRRSVAGNYMQRQRSELDWLRSAISSVSLPYERWQERFMALGGKRQLILLKRVKSAWLDGQADYFKKSAKKKRHALHAAHVLGGTLGLAALMHVGALVWVLLTDVGYGLMENPQVSGGVARWVLVSGVLLLVMIGLRFVVRRERAVWEFWDVRGTLVRLVPKRLLAWWGDVVFLGAGADGRGGRQNWLGLVMAVLWCVPLAVAVTGVSAGVVLSLAGSGWFPDVVNFGVVMMGTCFVGGGLTIARAEKELLSENAYQYAAMEEFFRCAGSRLGELLEEMEGVVEEKDRCAAVVERIHGLLFAVGKEALDENAEWLLLHRSRPLEPVMGG